jgi:diaminopropionate ammonia-lyase
VRHYRATTSQHPPAIIGVEPDSAACVLAAMRAGQIVEVPGPHPSIMAGLNAGLASPVAWPDISHGIDSFLAIPDDLACQAMRALAADGILAGETGAAGAAGLMALMSDPACAAVRARLALSAQSEVLLIISEGATDPDSYREIVGADPIYHCPSPERCTCRVGMRYNTIN